jgi:hypothetical protein
MKLAQRFGAYEVVAVLREEPRFYTARPAEPSWRPSSCLIRARIGGRTDRSFLREEAALYGIDCPAVPRLLDVGHDEGSNTDYYVVHINAIGQPRLLPALSPAERIASLLSIAEALGIAHASRVAYRNFVQDAFVVCGSTVFLYDISRAAALAPDGTVLGLRSRSAGDPPEALAHRYDGIRGDVYGLGALLKTVLPDDAGLLRLTAQMTDDDPCRRPENMAEVIQRLSKQQTRQG